MGVLRANACALTFRRWSEPSAEKRREQLRIGLQILRALIEICPPTAILAHGKEGVRAVSTLFALPLDPCTPLLQQSVRASLRGMGPVQLFAYLHLSGIGVEKGFAVGRMNDELETLVRQLASTL